MKVYTSYYGMQARLKQAGIVSVAISRTIPHWAEIEPGNHIQPLAPYSNLKGMEWAEYTREYKALLSRIDDELVIKLIRVIAKDRPVALLCWEKDSSHCHRSLVAEWLGHTAGLTVTEFGVPEKVHVEQELF